MLADAGISASVGSRSLIAHAKGFPVDLLLLRDDDIPQAVAMGTADLGIVGLNEVEEKGVDVHRIIPLGFGGCRLSLAVPREADYKGLEWFNGRRIATSYPAILSRFLKEKEISAEIHTITGSVEIAPAIGMADAIFDIVSSGGTLIQNGLVEVESVLESQSVLIATPDLPAEKQEELDKLCFRFRSIIESRGMKYVLMNLPKSSLDEALKILPGMKSPTILHLADPEWLSLHAVIPESQLWEKIEQLKGIGAEDILVLVLENIVK
ncbi:ATP phosphoribosyltransferase [Duncaniella muris]|uniref:ATP phosphoribosyltransferase n=1 Tax=Duncaniella muris TaxID=2094150 RepID=UPI00272CEFE2|nr:ATP phosphoribosyltransferase [Duncaniella muris]